MQSKINKEPTKGPESNLSVKTALGFYPQSTWCSPSPIFHRSKQPPASVRKALGAHRTLFFIGQNSLRLLSATHTVLTEPYFLSVKTAFGLYPQRTRWHVRCTPEHLHADVLCSFFISGVKLFIVCQLYCATLVIHSRTPAGRRVVHVFIRWG